MTRLFDQDRIVIGRADDADIQIVSEMVSRKHCRFERRGREWYVMDMGRTGGTYLDEERVDDYRLETGDRFRFGANWVEIVAIL